MSIKALGIILGLGGTALFMPNPGSKRAGLDVTVVDEGGNPIQGAAASINRSPWLQTRPFIGLPLHFLGVKDTRRYIVEERLADETGFVKYRFRSIHTPEGVSINKEGYYTSWFTFHTDNQYNSPTWTPYPYKQKVVLRKINIPIPLFVTPRRDLKWPGALDEPVGFDLLRYDWMPPHGGGGHEDLQFLATLKPNIEEGKTNFGLLTLTFAGKHDGFIPILDNQIIFQSVFKFPYSAPLGGYQNISIVTDKQDTANYGENINHFFRIRTELDEQGNIVSALYGRIEHLEYWVTGRIRDIRFYYWLNPTPNDNNLEWDGKTNLFQK